MFKKLLLIQCIKRFSKANLTLFKPTNFALEIDDEKFFSDVIIDEHLLQEPYFS